MEELTLAKKYIDEIDSLLDIDNGKLLGVKLNGRIMFVFPQTKTIIANQADKNNLLEKKESVYIETIPDNMSIANTSFDWNEDQWTMVMWNSLSKKDSNKRNSLMAHECFQRIESNKYKRKFI